MYIIERNNIDKAPKLFIDKDPWNYDDYKAEVFVQLVRTDNSVEVKFTVKESNPMREKTKNFQLVNQDSCVEFFANFDPENSDRYINFEMNANGVMNAAFRKDRYESDGDLKEEEIPMLNIRTNIYEDYWTAEFSIGFDFIKRYFPKFNAGKGTQIKGDFFKCGDLTECEHYLTHFDVKAPAPDFHRPECFGDLYIAE